MYNTPSPSYRKKMIYIFIFQFIIVLVLNLAGIFLFDGNYFSGVAITWFSITGTIALIHIIAIIYNIVKYIKESNQYGPLTSATPNYYDD